MCRHGTFCHVKFGELKGVTLSTIEGHLLLYYHAAVVWVYDPEVHIFAQIATQSGLSPGTASRAALAKFL